LEIIVERCAGLDVHKDTVAAAVRILEAGGKVKEEVRSFKTFTKNLVAMAEWLKENGVTHVAMESTGVYWKPVYNVLEEYEQFALVLANARRIKNVPGRKTDVKDCQWIAKLLQHGLIDGSFVPARWQRELRDLTRERTNIVGEKTRVANRIQKVLEDGNVKLGSVASDVLGVSGRAILKAIVAGEHNPVALANLALGRLRDKIPELRAALAGTMSDHLRFMLAFELRRLESIESDIAFLSQRIEAISRPFAPALQTLQELPGVKQRTAENLLAEIGADVQPFKTAGHLASWTGVCPGNNESAGKKKSARTTKGNRWCKRALTEAAWAAAHTKNTYFGAQFRRMRGKRGAKRAVLAVAHSLVVVIFHMMTRGTTYSELGPAYFDGLDTTRKRRYHLQRLRELGLEVTVASDVTAAA
jgi:transposase